MNKKIICQLARDAIEYYFKCGKFLKPKKTLPKSLLNKKAGIFVSLHDKKNDELRGCIGTTESHYKNIADEIIHNAVCSATEDFRFHPVFPEELKKLKISIYILSDLKKVVDFANQDPKQFGILIKTKTGKTGLLLPNLSGINKPEEQFAIACQKGGIDLTEPIEAYNFCAQVFEE